ncbi:hypothetical protein N658DRAFT_161651 [Parathielavia hyrcaniae]|uniref:Uncharacterized protein n=1 Tax=Parathielavia hyrcaniae TaxID=113614 RepID=A0AAN6PX54_9PEZI|nr:hypothetical protein N658DRAFT_161651 [Parathielavia hyrcaniae]
MASAIEQPESGFVLGVQGLLAGLLVASAWTISARDIPHGPWQTIFLADDRRPTTKPRQFAFIKQKMSCCPSRVTGSTGISCRHRNKLGLARLRVRDYRRETNKQAKPARPSDRQAVAGRSQAARDTGCGRQGRRCRAPTTHTYPESSNWRRCACAPHRHPRLRMESQTEHVQLSRDPMTQRAQKYPHHPSFRRWIDSDVDSALDLCVPSRVRSGSSRPARSGTSRQISRCFHGAAFSSAS